MFLIVVQYTCRPNKRALYCSNCTAELTSDSYTCISVGADYERRGVGKRDTEDGEQQSVRNMLKY